jgi:membrane-bound lytic murein transglycosylase B
MLATLLPGIACLALSFAVQAEDLSRRADVGEFIDTMVSKHHFKKSELTRVFSRTRLRQKIIDAITRPAESKPWYQYRPIFVTDKRVRAGVEFWNTNQSLLEQAEKVYGVPAEIITAIIGVETYYGRQKGGYRVIDSLSTLAFDYPKRGAFFRSELEQFLLMTREEDMDPLSVKGSYAGAMGQPQFIASSFRAYAIDFDKDGKRDIWNNNADVIGSVAYYFKRHGWTPGGTIASRARIDTDDINGLVDKGIKPNSSIHQLQEQGVHPTTTLPPDTLAALIELEQKNGHEYWLGMNNFYVITRYNHSPLYAMAVYQLGQEIRHLRDQAHSAKLADDIAAPTTPRHGSNDRSAGTGVQQRHSG